MWPLVSRRKLNFKARQKNICKLYLQVVKTTLFLYRVLFIWQFSTDWLKLLLLWPECTVYSTGTVHHCTWLRNMQCSTIAPQMHNLEKSLLCRSCILHFIREIERVNKLITAFFSPSHFLRLQKEEQWTRTIKTKMQGLLQQTLIAEAIYFADLS